MRTERKIEYTYEARAGFMYRLECPDCKGKLTMIKKVIHEDAEGIDGATCGKHAMAAVCGNRACWRYTNVNALRWWRKTV